MEIPLILKRGRVVSEDAPRTEPQRESLPDFAFWLSESVEKQEQERLKAQEQARRQAQAEARKKAQKETCAAPSADMFDSMFDDDDDVVKQLDRFAMFDSVTGDAGRQNSPYRSLRPICVNRPTVPVPILGERNNGIFEAELSDSSDESDADDDNAVVEPCSSIEDDDGFFFAAAATKQMETTEQKPSKPANYRPSTLFTKAAGTPAGERVCARCRRFIARVSNSEHVLRMLLGNPYINILDYSVLRCVSKQAQVAVDFLMKKWRQLGQNRFDIRPETGPVMSKLLQQRP